MVGTQKAIKELQSGEEGGGKKYCVGVDGMEGGQEGIYGFVCFVTWIFAKEKYFRISVF